MSTTPTRRARIARALARFGVAAFVAQLVALFIHRVAAPMDPPDPRTFPRAGDRFASRAEGFSQEVLSVDPRGRVSLRLVIAPGASGPPKHHHRTFTERFTVREGTLSIEVGPRVLQLSAGESIEIAPGVAHRPFNPGPTPVIVEGDAAMPITFAACLVQLYKIMDGHPDARGRTMPLQLSVNDAQCDTHVDAMPPAIERALPWIIGPWARLAGYRAWYRELSLHP
ncbi:MAG: cupin domain-containing protein [Myxococcales bacterium]|nr:cupin domain-containing protein [Myxococcales bacterium]